jgi:hypothetical protein
LPLERRAQRGRDGHDFRHGRVPWHGILLVRPHTGVGSRAQADRLDLSAVAGAGRRRATPPRRERAR